MHLYFRDKLSILLVLLAAFSVHCNVISTCNSRDVASSYRDVFRDMILNANCDHPTYEPCLEALPSDCADILEMGYDQSGVYEIWPMSRVTRGRPIDVYCDMETDGGGWTVIQRRGDFGRPIDYFFKDWKSYKEGFGDIEKDFWLGNDNIFALTNQELCSARFDLRAFDQTTRYAQYDTFWIEDEINKYTLRLSDYSGNAGDAMTKEHKDQPFSTKDQDNDKRADQHCAQLYKGGWWYSICHQANLNGLYHRGQHDKHAEGINWFQWKGYQESLQWTEIKIRPKDFRLSTLQQRHIRPSSGSRIRPVPASDKKTMPSSVSTTTPKSSSTSELTPM